MAEEYKVRDITQLERVERMQDGDCLVLVRSNADGTKATYRIHGSDFHGKDSYQIAIERYGYDGTYDDWLEAIKKVVDIVHNQYPPIMTRDDIDEACKEQQ